MGAPPSPAVAGSDGEDFDDITLVAIVSKGTYIRSLARDIALALGTVGHVTMLRRTQGRAVRRSNTRFRWTIWTELG